MSQVTFAKDVVIINSVKVDDIIAGNNCGLTTGFICNNLIIGKTQPISTDSQENVNEVNISGRDSKTVNGNVTNNVTVSGSSSVKILGQVFGNVTVSGSSSAEIMGDVDGDITSLGNGHVRIGGECKGKITRKGNSRICFENL